MSGSKFAFDKKAQAMSRIMRNGMQRVAEVTRDHFVENFDKQSFNGQAWAALERSEPPEKLNVTGQLKQKTQDSIKTVTSTMAVLENTATDSRGIQYSNFHNEGTDKMPARPIMKQDDELTKIQLDTLAKETGKIWNIL